MTHSLIAPSAIFRLSNVWTKARNKLLFKKMLLQKYKYLEGEIGDKCQTCSYWNTWTPVSRYTFG